MEYPARVIYKDSVNAEFYPRINKEQTNNGTNLLKLISMKSTARKKDFKRRVCR